MLYVGCTGFHNTPWTVLYNILTFKISSLASGSGPSSPVFWVFFGVEA